MFFPFFIYKTRWAMIDGKELKQSRSVCFKSHAFWALNNINSFYGKWDCSSWDNWSRREWCLWHFKAAKITRQWMGKLGEKRFPLKKLIIRNEPLNWKKRERKSFNIVLNGSCIDIATVGDIRNRNVHSTTKSSKRKRKPTETLNTKSHNRSIAWNLQTKYPISQ